MWRSQWTLTFIFVFASIWPSSGDNNLTTTAAEDNNVTTPTSTTALHTSTDYHTQSSSGNTHVSSTIETSTNTSLGSTSTELESASPCESNSTQITTTQRTSSTEPISVTENTSDTTSIAINDTTTTSSNVTTINNTATITATSTTTLHNSTTSDQQSTETSISKTPGGGSAGLYVLSVAVFVAFIGFAVFILRNKRRYLKCFSNSDVLTTNNKHSRRARTNNQNTGKQVSTALKMTKTETVSGTSGGSELDNVAPVVANGNQFLAHTTTPVPAQTFREYMKSMEASGGYEKQFKALPSGCYLSTAVATLEKNSLKNRFREIYPYDDTRVILVKEKDTDSDYINASYINGFVESMAYIAAQGPVQEAIDDFWHMIFMEGCVKIVMLTNLVEDCKIKCLQYWPQCQYGKESFGCYTVTLLKITERAHFVHRILTVTKTGNNGNFESRQVDQFHFTAWPDHNIPCTAAFVNFWKQIHHVPTRLSGPLLVHCSAGIGRTGSFIAVDILTKEVETTGCLSVFRVVKNLRRQRMNMVQTEVQYRFVHEAVAEILESKDTYILHDDLAHSNIWDREDDKGVKLPLPINEKLRSEFQRLEQQRPVLSKEDTKSGNRPENSKKNRFSHILPMEQYRVPLWNQTGDVNDYVNAVFLPSLSQRRGFIVTQCPLENTVADFWHMIYDWKVQMVISFQNGPKELKTPALCTPEENHIQLGALTVRSETLLPWLHGITCQNIQLQNQDVGEEWQLVSMYHVEDPETLTLRGTQMFLALAVTLLPFVDPATSPPVLIQCFDGARLSCLLCTLVTAIGLLESDSSVSPYLLARIMYTSRPEAFSTFDQYQFLVRCLLDHARPATPVAHTENLYANLNSINDGDYQSEERIYMNV